MRKLLFCLLIFGFIVMVPNVSAQCEGWLTGWDHRQGITIFGSSGAGTNYQVKLDVTYDAAMQADFDDLRVTAIDGVTELDYWIEDYTASTSAVVWVEVADNLNITQQIWMYYGNDAVSTTSNGDNTFIFYEDWTSESVRAAIWDIQDATGTISYSAVDANHGNVAKVEGNAGGDQYHITSDYDTASPIALMFRSYIEEAVDVGNTARQGSGSALAFAFNLVQTSETVGENFYVYDDDGNQDSQAMTTAYFDTWVTFQITRDGTNSKLYADTILIETASCDPDIITTNPIASIMCDDSEQDLYSDWLAGRKFITTEPVAVWSIWNTVNIAQFLFSVAFDMWGMDTALIILGLVMIPTSTIYLAYGAKHDRSSDRLFYGLILFFLGCGLFIGGVMP